MNLFAGAASERKIVEMHVSTFDGNRISPLRRRKATVRRELALSLSHSLARSLIRLSVDGSVQSRVLREFCK